MHYQGGGLVPFAGGHAIPNCISEKVGVLPGALRGSQSVPESASKSAPGMIPKVLPKMIPEWTFGKEFSAPIAPAKHGDSSGVRGAAWLWNDDFDFDD